MFKFTLKWLEQRVINRSTITQVQWEEAFSSLPLLNGLTISEKEALRRITILFLDQKVFEGAQGFVVTLPMTLIIGLQACLPILNLELNCYSGWLSVIVYSSGFAPKRVETDEYGIVHHVQSNLSGEAWQRGPVVLSWDDAKFSGIIDGSNLVIHEFAHKLDMQNGIANGFPPLHSSMDSARWVETFSIAFESLKKKCAEGESIGIDCYAASSPGEFFAVLSEVFFERPDILQKNFLDIYLLFQQYYKQDPLSRFQ